LLFGILGQFQFGKEEKLPLAQTGIAYAFILRRLRPLTVFGNFVIKIAPQIFGRDYPRVVDISFPAQAAQEQNREGAVGRHLFLFAAGGDVISDWLT